MRLGLVLLAFVLALATAAWAADEEAPRCDNCGMFFAKSAARVTAAVKVDDETHNHMFECLGCLHDYLHENYGDVMPSELMVLDYPTFGTDDEQMIDGFEAWYLFDTEERIPGSMPPNIAAFSTQEAAEEAQEELGGALVDFAGMKELMIAAKSEDGHGEMEMGDGEMHHDMPGAGQEEMYVCPCTGGCCDDVRSSEPGECPNCGMELIKEEDK